MKLQDTIKIMLKEEIKKDLSPILENLLNKMLVNKNQDVICRVKVKHPDNRTKLPHSDNTYLHYRVDIIFIGGYGTKHWPVTQAVQQRYDSLIDDMWNIVYDFTGKSIDIFVPYGYVSRHFKYAIQDFFKKHFPQYGVREINAASIM